MFFFDICPESISTLFLPALFAANIAAITLSGHFFKQADSYVYKYLTEDVNVLFGSDSSRAFDDGFEKWNSNDFVERKAEKKQVLEKRSIFRTIILTLLFLLSEFALIVPFAIGCLFQQSSNASFPCFAAVFLNIGFVLFIIGIIGMFILLVSKYITMTHTAVRKIGVNELHQRNPEIFNNP